jgi:hypothetical protein
METFKNQLTSSDYLLTLLLIMGDIKSAKTIDVLEKFEEKFGHLIPDKDYELNSNGLQKWSTNVRWYRRDLVEMGLMGSGGRGVWTITEEGKEWLGKYPDGGKEEFLVLLNALQKERKIKREGKSKGTNFKGDSIDLKNREVRTLFLEQVGNLIPKELSKQASHGVIRLFSGKNFLKILYSEFPQSHYELIIKGRGSVYDAFDFHFQSSKTEDNFKRLNLIESYMEKINKLADYEIVAEVWGKKYAHLLIKLPKNYILEKINGRLESGAFENQFLEEISSDLGLEFHSNYLDDLFKLTVNFYSKLMAHFINSTHEILCEVFRNTAPRSRRQTNKIQVSDQKLPYKYLNNLINQIDQFLQGRTSMRPSDEQLCDWVHFCYVFGLYKEGIELFLLIDPNEVNDWLYKRTKKFSQACTIKSN